MKDQFDNLRKKYRRIKNEKLNSGNVFSLDDTYKIDDPLLDKHAREREQERVITRNMADMAHHGKEAEMIATDTMGELYRNKATMSGTYSRVAFAHLE